MIASLIALDGAWAAEFPDVESLAPMSELPDPFLRSDGTRVQTSAEWAQRREEIKAIVAHYGYGHMPPPPGNVRAKALSTHPLFDGAAAEETLELAMGPNEALRVRVRLLLPKGGGRAPAIVLNSGKFPGTTPIDQEIVERGYALAVYDRTDLAPDEPDKKAPAATAYPDYDWATLSMWAWGGMRVLDYLTTLDAIDAQRVIITGHSRGGKTALLAGALDERFALVVANGSGCGGMGCFRVLGPECETLEAITDPKRFAYWFHPRLRGFVGRVERLPFDAHFLKALVAPRPLLSTDALDDLWANPMGTQVTYAAAEQVYEFLGAQERIGQHYRPGDHDQNAEDWRALLDFADAQFFGRRVARDFRQRPFHDAPAGFSWRAP